MRSLCPTCVLIEARVLASLSYAEVLTERLPRCNPGCGL